MDACIRAEENRKRFSLSTDVAAVAAAPAPHETQTPRGQQRTTEALGTCQPSKTVNLNKSPTAMDLGDVAQTPARVPAVVPTTEGDLAELISRAVATAMAPVDAQLKVLQTEKIAMESVEGINGSDGIGGI